MKRLMVAGLMRLYPSRWRAEYGEELADVLIRRPLGPRAIADLAMSAARQQLKLQEPWLLMGVPLLILSSWYWAVVFGGMEPGNSRADTAQWWWMSPAIFALAGFWTRMRTGRGAGRAAMKVSALATLPFFLVGVLAVLGWSGAGSRDWIWRTGEDPSLPDLLLVAPVLQIPFAGLIGWLGGLTARVASAVR